ncbi:type IV secretory system conjugative DNA transfer family protein [Tsukamurella sp. 8F]|uniref:type IV secretory system conjugative DNA transfer family protein n=1 Tax=unclassified Tsukamurella TaxID=2633480 RepID=UPI0023B9947C|nr:MULTISPECIES: TraM recognition domain-containing protein [unclassified Tsukamurella]MDF0531115.1 type IV secretory system conjugative DNA transfer family protein [Tsukamurella sp. 8J]MDF0588361.1 type IV secretory system conjugative DNA transfer family protein [Tsukamurella sp. 8F]
MGMPRPYGGFVLRDGVTVLAENGAHMMVSAQTESGKTFRVLAPNGLLHPGPAVVMSSKDDLMQLLLAKRPGPAQLLDLRSVISPHYPGDVTLVRHDPTMAVFSLTDAQTLADTLLLMSSVGIGGNINGARNSDPVWELQATGPLAGLLFTASPAGIGIGMEWALEAVEYNESGEDATAHTPSWETVARTLVERGGAAGRVLAAKVRRVLGMEQRQRDSIMLSVGKAIMPWLRSIGTDTGLPFFDPDFLDDPQATLYVLAPLDGSAAAAAITLVDNLVRRQRSRVAEWDEVMQIKCIIDEFSSICPMPKLIKYVNEGRGLGVSFVIAVQATSTIDQVYGRDYGEALRDSFPAVLVLYGADEQEIMQTAAHWAGLTTRRGDSYTITGDTTNSGRFGAMLEWQELLPRTMEEARLIRKGTPGVMVDLPTWEVVNERYEQAVRAELEGRGPQQIGRRRDSARGLMYGGFAAAGIGAAATVVKLIACGWLFELVGSILF